MTVAGAKATTAFAQSSNGNENATANCPCPRMSTMMAIQKSILYLYGGLIEKGEKQFTLNDMYSLGKPLFLILVRCNIFLCAILSFLDLHKLDEWKTILPLGELPEWFGSDSEDGESESDDSGSEESESD